MLALLEVELESLEDGNLPPTHGYMVHGLFFKILRDTDPVLSERLHKISGTMPFTLSPLYKSGGQPGQFPGSILEGKRLCFRMGLLNDELIRFAFQAVNKAMVAGPVQISGMSMDIKAVKLLKTLDADRAYENMRKDKEAPRNFVIDFKTLTSFRSGGRSLLFPETRLWLAGLYRSWRLAGGRSIEKGTLRKLAEDVYPVRYDLHTGMLDMGGYNLSGFTGFCAYEAHKTVSPEDRALLQVMLGLLPFTGVGYKTTMGMGQAECTIIERNKKREPEAST